VAQHVLAWLKGRAPKDFADPLPPAIDAAGWQRIDKAEIAAGAAEGRPRVKLTNWQSLLKVAKG
jgi:ferredoxin--NADP+ reductase